MKKNIACPHCHRTFEVYANPTPTVDVIIYHPERGIVIIKRKNIPHGYALPGGFIEEGEQAETAAVREMLEETGLKVKLKGLLGVYSHPGRDLRQHTMGAVYVGEADNPDALKAGDDAAAASFYPPDAPPTPLCFDHAKILQNFREYLKGNRCLAPIEDLPKNS